MWKVTSFCLFICLCVCILCIHVLVFCGWSELWDKIEKSTNDMFLTYFICIYKTCFSEAYPQSAEIERAVRYFKSTLHVSCMSIMLLVRPLADNTVSCSSRFKSQPWKPHWASPHLLMPPFSYCLSTCLHMAFSLSVFLTPALPLSFSTCMLMLLVKSASFVISESVSVKSLLKKYKTK